jgi:hypothetical protein
LVVELRTIRLPSDNVCTLSLTASAENGEFFTIFSELTAISVTAFGARGGVGACCANATPPSKTNITIPDSVFISIS